MRVVTYDISDHARLRRVAKICERYLHRVQKSVFEGELTASQLHALKNDLKKAIDKDEDHVLLYFITRASMRKKEVLGKKHDDPFVVL